MFLALLCAPSLFAQELALPGPGLRVQVPEGWTGSKEGTGPNAQLVLRNDRKGLIAVIDARGELQLDLSAMDPAVIGGLLEQSNLFLGEGRLVEHPVLGPTLDWAATMDSGGRPIDCNLRAFEIEASTGYGFACSARGLPEAEAALELVLGQVTALFPRVAPDKLPVGEIVAPAGYSITLPPGWRGATTREQIRISDGKVGGVSAYAGELGSLNAFRPGDPTLEDQLICMARGDYASEVVDPAAHSRWAENFKVRSRAELRGGAVSDGRWGHSYTLGRNTIPVSVEEEGELVLLNLGDRDGYLWRAQGVTGRGEPRAVRMFYTSYDDVGLLCRWTGSPDRTQAIADFEAAVATVRITDGAAHPMQFSSAANYYRKWPFHHPLLQLPVLVVGVMLLFFVWLFVAARRANKQREA